jgi:uncharacterized protein YfdQ (DUF2303 family)
MIDVKAILEAGQKLGDADGKITSIAGVPVAVVNGQAVALTSVLEYADQRAEHPRARKGCAALHTAASFAAYVNRFKDEHSAIFADGDTGKLIAILDFSPSSDAGLAPRWGRFRAVYECEVSRQWKEWIACEGKPLSQEALGDFLEANAVDLASDKDRPDLPKAAELIKMARGLVVNTRGQFERTINPTTGEYTMINKLEHESSSTRIYPRFLVGLPVFHGGDPYALEVLLRFTLQGGRPSFSLAFPDAPRVYDAAFADVVRAAGEATGLPVFIGTPE